MLKKLGFVVALLVLLLPVAIFAQEMQSVDEADFAYAPQIRSIADLLADYDRTSSHLLPILVPFSGLQAFDAGRIITDFENSDMPLDFVKRLATKGFEESGVMTYPVLVRLHPETHDYLIEASDGTLLLTVKRDNDYEPHWYVLNRFADLLAQQPSEFQWLSAVHDPARIVGWYKLITPEGAQAFDAITAAMRQFERDDGGDIIPLNAYTIEAPDSLRFTGIEFGTPGSNDVQMTIGYPSDLRGVALDIVSCTNLLEWYWSVLLSTNTAADSDSFSFSLPAVDPVRFFAAYQPDIDTDGDGIPDGVERFLSPERTDPNDPNDPANVKGSLTYETYSGGQTGPIYVVAVTNIASWSTNISTVISEPGPYQITRIPHGDYWIKAWRDSNGDGLVGTYEATGIWFSAAITITGQVVDVNFTMTDPDTDSDGMGDWWEMLHFGDLTEGANDDFDVDRLSNLMEYYAGTDPTQGFQDSDGDGMSDDWETAHGLDKYNAADAHEDPDGDGFTNLAEYLHGDFGTDPHDRDSHPPYFEDVTATAFPGAGNLASSQNAAWGDYDNDGDPDLYLASGVWRNDNGVFTKLPGTAFGPGLWLDANNNGYLDIFTWADENSPTSWALYTNCLPAGVEGFAKDTSFPAPPYDFSNPGFRSRAACPVDLDGDGHIDLYIGGYESWESDYYSRISYRDTMVRNMRGVTGSATPAWEISYQDALHSVADIGVHQFRTTDKAHKARRTKGITACDYDEDGTADIHVSVYRTSGNRLWSGAVGKRHFDAAGYRGISGWGNTIGSVWGDLDNDGYFDLFTANLRHAGTPQYDDSQFYRNLGPSEGYRFANKTSIVNLPWQEADSNPTMADFDRDGDLDLFVTCSTGGYPGRGRLFRNDEQWVFTEITDTAGLPTGTTGQGTDQNAWADFNGNGALDLFTGGRLYRNRTDAGNWIKLKMNGDGSIVNRAAIGTVVKIELGGKTLVRQVEGAVGEGNQNCPVLHFGLGTNAGPVSVMVRWPGHSGVVVTNLAINQTHTLSYTPPNNDNFANAVPLPGLSGRLTIRNGHATLEPGEPEHRPAPYTGAQRSLWWSFSPPTNGYLTVRCPEEHTTYQQGIVLALYQGTVLTNLVPVKKSESRGLYAVHVEAGQDYRLVVADRLLAATNRTIPLEWSFETTGTWRADTRYSSDGAWWPYNEKWVAQAPSGTPAGTRPFSIAASDLPDGSGHNPAELVFWPQSGNRTQGTFLDAWGVRMDGMAEWQPATTGQLTHVDHIYLEDGIGSARALYAGTNASGDTAVLEWGRLSYGNGSEPGWWEIGPYIYTNEYAAGLYRPFKLVVDPASINWRIIWAGNPATAAAGTALIQDVHHNHGIVTQFVITCTSPAGSELVHYHAFTNGNFMLTWQTDTTATNTAVLGHYTWNGTWLDGATVSHNNIYSTTEPMAYVPAHGSEPHKLIWAHMLNYDNRWYSALIQRLDANYAPIGDNIVLGPSGTWNTRPLGWRYLYDPGSGLEAYFRLEWLVEY